MARNNAYANEMLHGACSRLSQADLAAERTGFFPSIRETLNHVWEIDRFYLDALKEEGHGISIFDTPHLQTADELSLAQSKVDDELTAFCDTLEEDDLDRQIMQDRGEDGHFQETVGDTLLHLFQHQIHHRGQVHAMLSETPVAPPQLDEFFLKFERHPAAALHREEK
ncbi:damage-inducible protein DinB [Rhodobacterales bacterium]|nr:damage-inducible protein DinB [Rhodobacterales bacterium]